MNEVDYKININHITINLGAKGPFKGVLQLNRQMLSCGRGYLPSHCYINYNKAINYVHMKFEKYQNFKIIQLYFKYYYKIGCNKLSDNHKNPHYKMFLI